MWTPTHVQVTVQRARGLLSKGKNGKSIWKRMKRYTNDAFVTIALGKEKYQTSCKERAPDLVDWHEECELTIPTKGNRAEIILTALHRNFIGDEFLGQVVLPLSEFDFYEKPKNKWYTLRNKPGKDNKKDRGELEVKIGFTVRPGAQNAGSLSDLSKKDTSLRSSFGQLSHLGSKVGGSLLSLGSKEKEGLKSFAKSMGSKVSTLPGRGKKKNKDEGFGSIPEQNVYTSKKQVSGEADPGVISDEEDDFRFDELSHKSSHSSLSVSQVAINTPRDGSLENLGGGEFLRRSFNTHTPPPSKPPRDPTTTKAVETNRWSTGPVDEWDAKLFSKKAAAPLPPKDPVLSAPQPVASVQKPVEELDVPKKKSIKDPPSPKPSSNNDNGGVGALLFAATAVFNESVKEPVPKPRQVHQESKDDHDVEKKNKEISSKSGYKDNLSNIFGSQKLHGDDITATKGTPIGITNPIRMNEKNSEAKLPKEVLKKFEGKSKEELIELVLTLQSTVDYQRQKLGDMEDYIDNLIVRVMETKPTLLQCPFVPVRPTKSNKWSF